MKPIRYYINAIIFFSIMVSCSISINVLQAGGYLLFRYLSRRIYRKYMRFTQRLFGSLMLVLTYLFAPLEIVLTGDHEELMWDSKAVIIANHQIYTDWWYVWLMAWFKDAHGELKIILKSSLKKIPVFGWGMQFFEFIFLERKWSSDAPRLYESVRRALVQDQNMPLWLLMFPEGTVITDDTKGKCKAYADKAGIPERERPKRVLIPKSTGLYHVLKWTQGFMSSTTPGASISGGPVSVYDFTIGYSGLKETDCPYDAYPIDDVFLLNQGPAQIHIHVDKFLFSEIPGLKPHQRSISGEAISSKDATARSRYTSMDSNVSSLTTDTSNENGSVPDIFSTWLRDRFLEKDTLMKDFYGSKEFPVRSRNGRGSVRKLQVSPMAMDWISMASLLLGSLLSSIYILFF